MAAECPACGVPLRKYHLLGSEECREAINGFLEGRVSSGAPLDKEVTKR